MHSNKLKNIKFLLFDLCGVVLNDDKDVSGSHIESALLKLKHDIETAGRIKIQLGVISSTENDELLRKLKHLGISEIYSHSIDKVSQAEKLLEKHGLKYENLAYIGDELLDLPLLAKVGFSATPGTSRREVKRAVNHIVKHAEPGTAVGSLLHLIEKAQHPGHDHPGDIKH